MFAGPLDLLLYLVKKHELEVLQIPIARVAEQYLEILTVIEVIDVDAVGDFLEMATQLMEIKSRLMLPRHEEIEEEAVDDPRQELVTRLLEYKRYKEAANQLEERAREWQLRYERRVDDLSEASQDPADQPIHEVELWDLVSAFSRVIKQKSVEVATKIRYDDTPIEVHMERIKERLTTEGRILFTDFFEPGMHRSRMVGLFLAVLELIRHHHAAVEQDELFGEIWVLAPQSETAVSTDDAAAA